MKSNKTIENEKKEMEQRDYLNLESFEILRVQEAKGGVVFFDAKINGLIVNGMKVVPLRDGSGDFISWPASKGQDGKYHNYVFAWLRDETAKSMLAAVQQKLNEE